MAFNPFVLVTGISGFLGAHVVDQLVEQGHRVRGTVRLSKVHETQESMDTVYGTGRVDVVAIDDLVHADFTAALRDITAVIHVAAPVVGRADAETTLNASIEGSMRVLRQGYEAGIRNYSICSTVLAMVTFNDADPNGFYTDKSWNNLTREDALDPACDIVSIYIAGKTLAEKEIWKFAEVNPDVNVTVLNPTMFLGPTAPGQTITVGNAKALSTDVALYNILIPGSKIQNNPLGFVDVRDVSAALIAGSKVVGKNRVPFTGEWFKLTEAVECVAALRPELKGRLAEIPPTSQTKPTVDTSKALKILGLKPRPWKYTVIQTVDYLVKLEKDWASQGFDLDAETKGNEWRA